MRGSPVSATRSDWARERKAMRPRSQPVATPTATPITDLPTSSQATHCSPQPLTAPLDARNTAAYTKGKASPSLSPASDVSAKRTSSSSSTSSAASSTLGPATWTSEASTGSVGDSAAPSRSAAAGAMPRPHHPSTATPAMVRGIAMPSSFHVAAQRPHPARSRSESGRSRARPTPMRAMSTVTSATCSMSSRCSSGSKGAVWVIGRRPMSAPTPMSTRGADRAARCRTDGSTTARSRDTRPRGRRGRPTWPNPLTR